jgi:hypothetical protein
VTPTLVVPDTGILLAQAFGSAVDPQAGRAQVALTQAVAAQLRIVAPPSIARELERKLAELDTIYEMLREATSEALRQTPEESGLALAERVLLQVKQTEPARSSRFFATIEADAVERILALRSAPLTTIFAGVAANAWMIKEGIRLRSRPTVVEFLDYPDPISGAGRVPGVSHHDWTHLSSCQQLAEREGGTVVFVVVERNLEAHKRTIEQALPLVRVTTPTYLNLYLVPGQ